MPVWMVERDLPGITPGSAEECAAGGDRDESAVHIPTHGCRYRRSVDPSAADTLDYVVLNLARVAGEIHVVSRGDSVVVR